MSNWVKVFFSVFVRAKAYGKAARSRNIRLVCNGKGILSLLQRATPVPIAGRLEIQGIGSVPDAVGNLLVQFPSCFASVRRGRLLSRQRAARWAKRFLSAREREKVQVGIRPAHCEAKGAQNRLNLALRAGRSKTRGTSSSVHRPVCFKFPTLYSGLRRCRGSSPGRSFHRR